MKIIQSFLTLALLATSVDAGIDAGKGSKKGGPKDAKDGDNESITDKSGLNPQDTTQTILGLTKGDKYGNTYSQCSGEPYGSAFASYAGVPSSVATTTNDITVGSTATAMFNFGFSSDLTEFVYNLNVTDPNYVYAAFVNFAVLLCTADDPVGVTVALLNYEPMGGKSEGQITRNDLTANFNGETIKCGEIPNISTVAALFDAIAQGYIKVAVQVDDFISRQSNAEIWGALAITEIGGKTDILYSPGSGCVIATGENMVCATGAVNCLPDDYSLSYFKFEFSSDLATMSYETGSDEPTLVANGAYFKSAALYCGNGGQDGFGSPLANIYVNADGTAYSGSIQSTTGSSFGLISGATCGGVSIQTLAALREAMNQLNVYYEVETIRGQNRGTVVLNKN